MYNSQSPLPHSLTPSLPTYLPISHPPSPSLPPSLPPLPPSLPPLPSLPSLPSLPPFPSPPSLPSVNWFLRLHTPDTVGWFCCGFSSVKHAYRTCRRGSGQTADGLLFSNHKVNSQSSFPHHSIVPMHISANPLHQRTRWRLPHVDFVRQHKATSTFNGANRRTATATLRHFSVCFNTAILFNQSL